MVHVVFHDKLMCMQRIILIGSVEVVEKAFTRFGTNKYIYGVKLNNTYRLTIHCCCFYTILKLKAMAYDPLL